MSEHIRELQQGDFLFKEGDAADCAYIVESGALEISTHSEGEQVIICTLTDGDIVGEMGIIDNEPRTANALALKPTRLTPVTRNQLTDRIQGADAILKLLIQILLDRYRSGLTKVKGEHTANKDAISEEAVREYIYKGIDKIRLEVELKDALTDGQLKVFYQPLLNIEHRKIAGFEALTRWIHPERGFISPGLFITLAEETDLIVPVGLYVFEQACKGMATFETIAREHEYPEPLFMSINVSGRQIADPSFIGEAARIAKETGVPPGQIKLEITESLAVNIEPTQQWIAQAHEVGFKVSLDDFGTGFSSLETLYRLDLDNAKVDQAFIKGLQSDAKNRQLLRDIVTMIRGLGLDVVVEGIETKAQLEFISALDCHYGQGFLFSKSIPEDEVCKLLEDPPDFGG